MKSKKVIKRLPLAVKTGRNSLSFSHAYLHEHYMQTHIISSCQYIGYSSFVRGFLCLMTKVQWVESWAGSNHLFRSQDRTWKSHLNLYKGFRVERMSDPVSTLGVREFNCSALC